MKPEVYFIPGLTLSLVCKEPCRTEFLQSERAAPSTRAFVFSSRHPSGFLRHAQQNSPQAANQDENDPRVPITFLPALGLSLFVSLFFSTSHFALSDNIYRHNAAATRQPYALSFLSYFSLPLCSHLCLFNPITDASAPLLYKTRHSRQLARMYIYKTVLQLVEEGIASRLVVSIRCLFYLRDRLVESLSTRSLPHFAFLSRHSFSLPISFVWTTLRTLHSNPKAKFVTRVVQFGSEPLFSIGRVHEGSNAV